MESEDSEAREDSASEDSHPSTDASEDSVEVRVGGVTRPPPPNCNPPPSPYSPQIPYSPGRVYSPPLNTFTNSYASTTKLPPKLRKPYNTLASNSLSQVFASSETNQAIAFAAAAAAYDQITSPAAKRPLLSNNNDDVQVHSRRRKLVEPRRVCSGLTRKRSHSPSSDERPRSPHLSSSSDIPRRPIKQLKVSTPDPSPPQTNPCSPISMTQSNSLLHPSIFSPLVRPPTLSPTLSPSLSSALAPQLLSQGWPPNHPYQHYSRLLGSVLPSPLALLPGALHLPHIPLMPLFNTLHTPDSVPSIAQSPPRTRSPTPSNYQTIQQPKSEETVRKILQDSGKDIDRNLFQTQDEPISLVKREEHKRKQLFSIATLVEESRSPPSPTESVNAALSKTKVNILSPAEHVATDFTVSPRIKEEVVEPIIDSNLSLRRTPRLGSSVSIAGPSSATRHQLTNSELHQQQQLLRQKQRNYKNMTRERRIEANARERTRVHTISSAYEKLRQSVPSYSHTQKLSKLSILRIAASYILTLSKLADDDPESVVGECVEETTRTIQFEGKAKKKRED